MRLVILVAASLAALPLAAAKPLPAGLELEFVDQGMGFNQLRTEKGYIYPNGGTNGELGSGLGLILMGYFLRKFEGSYAISSEGQGKGTKVVIQLKIAGHEPVKTT